MVLNILYCCGNKYRCRTYCIATDKLLQFTDECAVCGNSIAQVVKIVDGKSKVIVRKRGQQALQLLQRYLKLPIEYSNIDSGTYANSLIYFNNRGQIYDFNYRKIGKNEDFCGNVITN